MCVFSVCQLAEMESLSLSDDQAAPVIANSASLLVPNDEKGVSYVSLHVKETTPAPMAEFHGLKIKGMEMCEGLEFDDKHLEALHLVLQNKKTTLSSFLSEFRVDNFVMIVKMSSATNGVHWLSSIEATLSRVGTPDSTSTHKADSPSSLALSIFALLMREASGNLAASSQAAPKELKPKFAPQLSTIAEASFSGSTSKASTVSSSVDRRKEQYDAVRMYLEAPNTSAINLLQEYFQSQGYSLKEAVQIKEVIQRGPPNAPKFHQKIVVKKAFLGLDRDVEVEGSSTTAKSARQQACCFAVLEMAKQGIDVMCGLKRRYGRKY